MRSPHRIIVALARLLVTFYGTTMCIGCSSGSGNSLVNGSGGQGAASGTGGESVGGSTGSGGNISSGDDAGSAMDTVTDRESSSDGGAFAPLTWTKTRVPGTGLDAIGGTGENDIWATGRNGKVFISTGNDQWAERPTDVTFDLYKMWGPSPDNVWVAVNANIVLHWTGKWQHEFQGINAGERFRDVTGSSASDVFVASGRVLHSVGDGIWSEQKVAGQSPILNIWALGPDEILAADDDKAYSIKNGAVSPLGASGLPTQQLRGLWGSSPSDVYVVKSAGIAHLRNGTWTVEYQWTQADQYGGRAVWGASPTEVFVSTSTGLFLRSHGDGKWTLLPLDPDWTTNLLDESVGVWGTGASNVYIARGNGTVYHARTNGN